MNSEHKSDSVNSAFLLRKNEWWPLRTELLLSASFAAMTLTFEFPSKDNERGNMPNLDFRSVDVSYQHCALSCLSRRF